MNTSLRLVGDFEIMVGDPAKSVHLPNGRATTLLKLLGVHRNHVVPVDLILDSLWPDGEPASAVQTVASLVSRLRRVVGLNLQRQANGYRLDTTTWYVDVDEAERLIRSGERWLNFHDPVLADRAARQAIGLLTPELLTDTVPGDWLERARTQHEALVRRARRLGWTSAYAVGANGRGRELAEAAIAQDPLDEAAYRAAMVGYFRCNEPALALRKYVELREHLETELGTSPDTATDRLHAAILRGNDPGGKDQTPTASRRPQQAIASDLAGRQPELARAAEMWHDVARGSFRSLLMVGTPGSGKTAVLDELVRHARATGAAVFSAQASAETQHLPLFSLSNAIRSYSTTAHPDEVRAAAVGGEELLSELIPEFESVFRSRGRQRPAPSVLQPSRLVDAVVRFLGAVSDQRPVLLAIDDVKYLDQLTAATVSTVRRDLANSPIAVVVTADNDRVPQALSSLPRLPVQALSPAATTELADRAHLGHLAAVVHELTAGHPGFVVEALHCARQGADLTAELPPKLIATALARIDRAGVDVTEGLATYAALGPRFTAADAVRMVPDPAQAVLRRATAAGLLVSDGEWFQFESRLLHAAVCTTVPAALRQLLGSSTGAPRPGIASAA
jgi:DNA-binding SARP family transcriptional activator